MPKRARMAGPLASPSRQSAWNGHEPANESPLDVVWDADMAHLWMLQAVQRSSVHDEPATDASAHREIEAAGAARRRTPEAFGQRGRIDIGIQRDRDVQGRFQCPEQVRIVPPRLGRGRDEAISGRGTDPDHRVQRLRRRSPEAAENPDTVGKGRHLIERGRRRGRGKALLGHNIRRPAADECRRSSSRPSSNSAVRVARAYPIPLRGVGGAERVPDPVRSKRYAPCASCGARLSMFMLPPVLQRDQGDCGSGVPA